MPPETLEYLERLGFPIFISLVLLWGIWKAAVWLGREILVPVKDKLIVHFTTVEAVLGQMPVAIANVERHLERQSSCLRELVEGQGDARKLLEQLRKAGDK